MCLVSTYDNARMCRNTAQEFYMKFILIRIKVYLISNITFLWEEKYLIKLYYRHMKVNKSILSNKISLKSPKILLTLIKQRICLPQNPHFQLGYAT